MENRRQNKSCLGICTSAKKEDIRKGYRMGEYGGILCTQYENGKMRYVEIIPGMGEAGVKENDGGGEFS
jgi:hypothetical protein